MNLGWKRLIGSGVGAGIAGLLVAWSGLFSVAASSGHWPITAWFLHWTMINSVETHAAGIDSPPLRDQALIARGAGHFAEGCAPCHGAPGKPQSPIVRHMTPAAPTLSEKIRTWRDRELFWIVKHGIKFSAMPAWTTQQRDDEVWAVVAFLRQLPEMDARAYQRAAYGAEPLPLEQPLARCAACHGRDGLGRDGDAFPIIAGQTEAYLLATLKAYAAGARHSGIMQPQAGTLTGAEMRGLAAHYARQDIPSTAMPAAVLTSESSRLGALIARQGVPQDGVPACEGCHGSGEKNPFYPRLYGQHASYLRRQLELWAAGQRGGSAYAPVMNTVGHQMNQEQIEAVAAYYGAR